MMVISMGFALALAADATYVGAAKCKMCHKDQYAKWEASKHAKAWDLLKADEQAKDCAGCHSTGPDKLPGVQCEACHGPGSGYKKPTIMSKSKYKADAEAQRKLAVGAGLTVAPGEDVCTKCHNKKSPNFKEFDFAKRKETIKHWE